jgi:hypothetical protein
LLPGVPSLASRSGGAMVARTSPARPPAALFAGCRGCAARGRSSRRTRLGRRGSDRRRDGDRLVRRPDPRGDGLHGSAGRFSCRRRLAGPTVRCSIGWRDLTQTGVFPASARASISSAPQRETARCPPG